MNNIFFIDESHKIYPEWEAKKLGEIVSIRTGKLDANAQVENGAFRFYTCAKNYSMIDDYAFDTEALLISGNGAHVGYIHYYKGKFNAYQRTYVVEVPKADTKFIQYYLERHLKQRIEGEKNEGSMPYIVLGTLTEMPVRLPSLTEQQQIAEFFSALDERIALTADKVKLLKEQKRGYLQRVFAQEIVFTDDNGDRFTDWEQKKLGEVAEIIGGGTPSTGESSYWDGDINWFSPTDVGKSKYLNESTRKITEAGLKNSSAKIHPVGTVLLTTRASLGRMGILRSEAATNQGFQSLLPRDNTTSEFLYYLQPQIETYCDVKASGSTFKEISGKEIAKMPVKLPSIPEQEKIANFFSALDEQIELNENKLSLLKEQKKGYLQGIFE